MFVQVIRGKVKDASAMHAQVDRWDAELKPGAQGYLGSTQGAADDGRFVAVVRFESEDAARRNSERPEQAAWWDETSKLLDEVSFHDCPAVDVLGSGGSDEAGFVQVMIYRPKDADAVRALNRDFERVMGERRDMIGGTSAVASDGTFVDTAYFTSESEAREGEAKEPSAEVRALFQKFQEAAGDVEFVDLRDPWLYS